MTLRAVSKYRVRSSRTSSGSRLSDRPVKPTRSANRTETSRRSVAGMTISPASTASARGAPHSPQNLSPGWFAAAQEGHEIARPAAHWAQNLRPGRFSAPHREQTNMATPPNGLGRAYHHAIPVEEGPMFTLTMRFTLPEDTDWSKIPALMEERAGNLYVNIAGS